MLVTSHTGWRGANSRNMDTAFEKDFPGCGTAFLACNYRCVMVGCWVRTLLTAQLCNGLRAAQSDMRYQVVAQGAQGDSSRCRAPSYHGMLSGSECLLLVRSCSMLGVSRLCDPLRLQHCTAWQVAKHQMIQMGMPAVPDRMHASACAHHSTPAVALDHGWLPRHTPHHTFLTSCRP